MPDLDELLAGDVADVAAGSVDTTPDLAILRTRGVRRRQLRRTALACLAVAAVVAVAFQLPGTVRPEPTDPAPPPSPTASPTGSASSKPKLSAADVVDHGRAMVASVVVSPEDPDVRAVVWRRGDHWAIAVTEDAFETRHLVRAHPFSLTPLGTRGFLLEESGKGLELLSLDGELKPVEVAPAARPVGPGEVFVGLPGSAGWDVHGVAVDPVTAVGHEVPVPEAAYEARQDSEGRLHAVVNPAYSDSPGYHWSDDGGLTWRRHPLPDRDGALYVLLPSANPSILVARETSESYRTPLTDAFHLSRDDGATWQRTQPDGTDGAASAAAQSGTAVILPDGSFLVQSASDRGRFYLSEDGQHFAPVEMGAPFNRDPDGPAIVGLDVRTGGVTIYAADGASVLYRSDDNGVTWHEVRAR